MQKYLSIIAILTLFTNFIYARETNQDSVNNAQVTTKSYKLAKVKLTSGKSITGRKLVIDDASVSFKSGKRSENRTIELAEIEEIIRPTKNGAGIGFLVGALVGGVAMVIVENNYEQPETKTKEWRTYESWGYIDHSIEVTEEKEMAIGPKIGIVAGGALLGTLVGMTIKTGWEKIYPKTSEDLSFKIRQHSDMTMLNLEYKF